MTARRTKTLVRADRVARAYAKELEELEAQKRKIDASVRAKRRAIQKAEREARQNAVLELGELVAQLADATSFDDVVQLREAIESNGLGDWISRWEPVELSDINDSNNDPETADGACEGDNEVPSSVTTDIDGDTADGDGSADTAKDEHKASAVRSKVDVSAFKASEKKFLEDESPNLQQHLPRIEDMEGFSWSKNQ